MEEMYNRLRQVFHETIPISDEDWALLRERISALKVKKREQLVGFGDVAREIFCIDEGLLRLYGVKEGEEKTLFFFKEGMVASSLDSLLSGAPSQLILEALEDTQLMVLRHSDFQELAMQSAYFPKLALALTQARLSYVLSFFSSFVLDSPEERYRKFVDTHPDLIQRIPQHIIASFLGVTPVSLSRIRKRVANN